MYVQAVQKTLCGIPSLGAAVREFSQMVPSPSTHQLGPGTANWKVEVLSCLSGEVICTVDVDSGWDVLDLQMHIERVTGTVRASQQLLCSGRQLLQHEELRTFNAIGASVIQVQMMLVDPEWVQVIQGMEYGTLRLEDAGDDLRDDAKVVMAAVRCSGLALEHAAERFKSQREVVRAAVGQNGLALRFAAHGLRADLEVVLMAVQSDGLALEFADPCLQGRREVVHAAVQRNGFALQFASEDLQADREIVLTAVQRDGRALAHASPDLKADREVVLIACADNSECHPDVPTDLFKDPEVIAAMMQGVRIGGDMGGMVAYGIELQKSLGIWESKAADVENTCDWDETESWCSCISDE